MLCLVDVREIALESRCWDCTSTTYGKALPEPDEHDKSETTLTCRERDRLALEGL